MAVHHDRAVVRVGKQKIIAYPQHVFRHLPFQRFMGIYPGVDEIIIPDFQVHLQPGQEFQVLMRESIADAVLEMRHERVGGYISWNSDAVAVEHGVAAKLQPWLAGARVVEEFEELRLVVSLQVDGLETVERAVEQEIDSLPTLQSTIDVIAQIDDDPANIWRPVVRIGADRLVELALQINAAVYVAHHIDPRAHGNVVFPP
jgi:hypothetical protein